MDYCQTYVDALLDHAGTTLPYTEARVIGEITADDVPRPHLAVFVELVGAGFLGTTAGLADRPAPLPVADGFQYFELCAFTARDSPRLLAVLSQLGTYMLGAAGPAFWASADVIATWQGEVPAPTPFLPYETMRLDDSGLRFLLVPRWQFTLPGGRPIEVVEPLPITPGQWERVRVIERGRRRFWVDALGLDSRAQWNALLPPA